MPDNNGGWDNRPRIGLPALSIVLLGGTLAWLAWSSGATATVTFATDDDDQAPRIPTSETGKFTPPLEANLLFISVDTTRADHLGCYGYDRPTSPHIDALAADGHLFTAAYTVMPTTLPAHATMFTSLYPAQHGVRRNGVEVPAEAYTMAERLGKHGFETAAVVGAMVLSPRFGLKQGFDTYIVPPSHEWRATRVRRAATRWLRGQKDRRFFCFVHFYDPHNWYKAPREFAARFQAPNMQLPPERGFLERRSTFTSRLCAATIGAYDAEIRYADDEVGHLLDKLAEFGLRQRTIIVFVSDHGETLDELLERYDYAFAHGEFLYRRELRVPFILWLPREFGLPGPAAHAEPVSLLDLLPTLLELLGVPCEQPFEGRSLVPLLTGSTLDPRPIISERHAIVDRQMRESPLLQGVEFAVVDGRWHWIHATSRADELLDIGADPFERTNVLDKYPETAARLATILQSWSQSLGRPLDQTGQQPVDPELIRSLRALGYLGGSDDEDDQHP